MTQKNWIKSRLKALDSFVLSNNLIQTNLSNVSALRQSDDFAGRMNGSEKPSAIDMVSASLDIGTMLGPAPTACTKTASLLRMEATIRAYSKRA